MSNRVIIFILSISALHPLPEGRGFTALIDKEDSQSLKDLSVEEEV